MTEELKAKKEIDFTNGPILGPLVRFTGPILAAILIQSLYSSVDLMIVGQFGAAANVSGVSVGASLTFTFQSVITALSMGTTVLLGQYIGEGRRKDANRVVGTSVVLFAAIAIAVTVILFALAVPCLNLLQTPAEAMSEGTAYVRICSVGMIFIVAYNVLGSIFRGIGDSKTPLIAVGAACVINILGDLLLVGAFHMAAAGAAVATVIAQAISVAIALWFANRRGLPFDLNRETFRFDRQLSLTILKLGIPLALQSAIVSGSFLILNAVMNSLGVIASAGIGVASRLTNFIMLFPSAAMQSLSAVTAHNVGARKLHRAKRAVFHSVWMCLVFSCLMSILSFFNGTILTGIFTNDPEVMVAAAEYMKAYAIDCFLCSFLFSLIGYFNGCGRTKITLIQVIPGVVLRAVAAIVIKGMTTSLFLIGLSTPIATTVQLIILIIYFFATNRKLTELYDLNKE